MRRTDEIDPAGVDPAAPPGAGPDEPEELLVEEISIDGMCGVY